MTDPVDTDALRAVTRNEGLWESEAALVNAAADEVDRLRNTIREYSKQLSDAGAAESRAYAERDRLRGAIENAPHDEWCKANWDHNPCSCWKADTV